MPSISAPIVAVWLVAAVFATRAVIHFIHPSEVRVNYPGWDFRPGFRIATGALEFATAALLLTPHLRGWGVGIAIFIVVSAMIMLLAAGKYRSALVPGLIMLALGPAALAIPPASSNIRFSQQNPARPAAPIDARNIEASAK